MADGRRLVEASGLAIVGEKSVAFDAAGATLVWVLAESHLVLHVWKLEGFATIDLHVCDYTTSNASKARRLVTDLSRRYFKPGDETWKEIEVAYPTTTARS